MATKPGTDRSTSRVRFRLTLATQVGEGIDGYILGGLGAVVPAVTTALSMSTWMVGLIGDRKSVV